MENYKLAQEEFIASDVDENLICLVGMNRKSRNYDKPYYKLLNFPIVFFGSIPLRERVHGLHFRQFTPQFAYRSRHATSLKKTVLTNMGKLSKLYENLKKVFLDGENIYESLLNSAKNINQKPGTLWRSLLFKTTNIGVVRKNGKSSINKQCPFINCKKETELKEVFFKYLHVFKAMATLSDYFDLI